jgi:Flp pilus assembly protein TadD
MDAKRCCLQIIKLGLLVCLTLASFSHKVKSIPPRAKYVSAAQKRQAAMWGAKARQAGRARKYRLAVSYSLKAIALDPTNELYFYDLGISYEHLKNHRAAVQAYRKVLVLHRPTQDTLIRGLALVQLHRFSEAIPPLQEATRSRPDSTGFLYLGAALHNSKRYAEAAGAYAQYTRFKPQDANGFFNLDKSFYFARRYNEAAQAFSRHTKLKPGNPYGFLYQGQSFYYTKQYVKAKQNFDKYTKRKLYDTNGFVWLGNALLKLRRVNKAVTAYKEALRLDPSNKIALYNLKLIEKLEKHKCEAANIGRLRLRTFPFYLL